ncbi:hypothetical protein G7Y89_g9316 [Cudoniella acicularis]|uniref:Uncharacterized protein n=1 Tax=Cudoniella acicularis TaxID=354080 RepID=A0A8H4RHJ3_9HELO|nr:hypothetical protein G7Y89_g9316 [Cudoniella acicularis]
MLIVIAANAAKACIMILTILKLKAPTLVTVGDAVASFLEVPDPTTKDICLSTKVDVRKRRWKMQPAKPWTPTKRFWFRAASIKRRLTCSLFCLIGISFGVFFWALAMPLNYTYKDLWDLGFGTITPDFILTNNGVHPNLGLPRQFAIGNPLLHISDLQWLILCHAGCVGVESVCSLPETTESDNTCREPEVYLLSPPAV